MVTAFDGYRDDRRVVECFVGGREPGRVVESGPLAQRGIRFPDTNRVDIVSAAQGGPFASRVAMPRAKLSNAQSHAAEGKLPCLWPLDGGGIGSGASHKAEEIEARAAAADVVEAGSAQYEWQV